MPGTSEAGTGERAAETRFWYAPDGSRYKQQTAGKTIYYIGTSYEYIVTGEAISDRTHVQDYLVIERTPGERRVRYLYKDRLGSIDTITDETGEVVERHGYDAFGKPLTSDWEDAGGQLHGGEYDSSVTPRGFGGHEHLDGHGLIHMGGRAYDPALGRFLSVDPFIQNPGNTQSLNPYSYVLNNPLSGVDPTGYQCEPVAADSTTCIDSEGPVMAAPVAPATGENGKSGQRAAVESRSLTDLGVTLAEIESGKAKNLLWIPLSETDAVAAPEGYKYVGAAQYFPEPIDPNYNPVQIVLFQPVGGTPGGEGTPGVAGEGKAVPYIQKKYRGGLIGVPQETLQAIDGAGILLSLFSGISSIRHLASTAVERLGGLLGLRNAARGAGTTLARSGPVARSLGAMSRAEHLARKLKLNLNSPTTRQVLNSPDDTVADFIGKFRVGSIKGRLPSEVLNRTVEEALQHSSTVRKLLIDSRFAK